MSGKASRTGLVVAFALLMCAPSARAAAWLPAFDLGFEPDGASAAMTADGTSVYAGRPFVDTAYRAAVRVRPPGGPLGPLQYLSPAGINATTPVVAAGPDGRVVAAWSDGGVVKTAVLMPGATSFDDVLPMPSTAGQTPGSRLALAVDGASDALVLWDTRGTNSAYVRFGERPASGPIAGTQQLDIVSSGTMGSASMDALTIAAATDGSAIAAWVSDVTSGSLDDSYNARAALRKAGQPFGSSGLLQSAYYPDSGSVASRVGATSAAITPSGHAAVAWEYFSKNGTTQIQTINFAEGDANAGLGPLVDAGAGFGSLVRGPVLALGPGDSVAIAALGEIAGVYRAQIARRPPGGIFGIVDTPAPSGPAAQTVDLTANASGALVAAWSTTTGSPDFKAAVAGATASPGGSFGAPATLASGLKSLPLPQPDVALSPSGDGVAAWPTSGDGAAAGYDASPPSFGAPTFPPSATVGVPAVFGIGTPTDAWGPIAAIAWDFGDGATGDGQNVQHAYAAPGDRTAKVTVTDAAGNAASANGVIAVGAAATDTTPPALSAASLSRSVFVVGAGATALTAVRHRRGTVIRFTSSEPAAAVMSIARARPGKRRGKRCVKPTARLRRAKRCTRYLSQGALRRNAVAGPNKVPFSGRIGKHALKPGRYRLKIVATDAASNASRAVALPFRIVRR